MNMDIVFHSIDTLLLLKWDYFSCILNLDFGQINNTLQSNRFNLIVAFPELTIPRSQRRNDFISLLKSVPRQ